MIMIKMKHKHPLAFVNSIFSIGLQPTLHMKALKLLKKKLLKRGNNNYLKLIYINTVIR